MSMRWPQHVSPQEADRRMASAGEIPFTNDEIEAMVRSATRGGTPPPRKLRLMPHLGDWARLAASLVAAATLFALWISAAEGSRSLDTATIPARALSPWSNGCSDPTVGHLASGASTPSNPPTHSAEQP